MDGPLLGEEIEIEEVQQNCAPLCHIRVYFEFYNTLESVSQYFWNSFYVCDCVSVLGDYLLYAVISLIPSKVMSSVLELKLLLNYWIIL